VNRCENLFLQFGLFILLRMSRADLDYLDELHVDPCLVAEFDILSVVVCDLNITAFFQFQ